MRRALDGGLLFNNCIWTVMFGRINPWLTSFWSVISLWVALWVENILLYYIVLKQLLKSNIWRCSQTCEIRYRPHFVLISSSYKNPPSPNELLSKGCSFADIKASAKASRKTLVCIVLKQRSNSGYYGQVCYLEKQVAAHVRYHQTGPVAIHRYMQRNQAKIILLKVWCSILLCKYLAKRHWN